MISFEIGLQDNQYDIDNYIYDIKYFILDFELSTDICISKD